MSQFYHVWNESEPQFWGGREETVADLQSAVFLLFPLPFALLSAILRTSYILGCNGVGMRQDKGI